MNQKNDCCINHLSSDDVDLMRSLLNLFGGAFQEQESYCNNQPTDSYLEHLLGKEHFIALVATQSNQVVGGLAAYELQKFEQQRSEIYIYDLSVHASFRRQAIATKLINALQKEARKRGVWVIFVQADYGDKPAIQLYQKLGIREEVLHFDIAPDNGEKHA